MYLLQKALNTDWYILTTIVKTLKYNFYPVEFEVQHYAFLSIRLFVFEYCCCLLHYFFVRVWAPTNETNCIWRKDMALADQFYHFLHRGQAWYVAFFWFLIYLRFVWISTLMQLYLLTLKGWCRSTIVVVYSITSRAYNSRQWVQSWHLCVATQHTTSWYDTIW